VTETVTDLPGPSNLNTTNSLPNDIAHTVESFPVQPVNMTFPQTKFGNSCRSFNATWYNSYKWLEYSVLHDTCFCYPCCIFGTISFGVSRPEVTFTTSGFRNWKKATGKDGTLNKHANSIAHKNAEVAWHQYRENMKQGTTIPEWYNSNRTTTIMQNRHYLKSILQALLYCAHQEIALHGH